MAGARQRTHGSVRRKVWLSEGQRAAWVLVSSGGVRATAEPTPDMPTSSTAGVPTPTTAMSTATPTAVMSTAATAAAVPAAATGVPTPTNASSPRLDVHRQQRRTNDRNRTDGECQFLHGSGLVSLDLDDGTRSIAGIMCGWAIYPYILVRTKRGFGVDKSAEFVKSPNFRFAISRISTERDIAFEIRR